MNTSHQLKGFASGRTLDDIIQAHSGPYRTFLEREGSVRIDGMLFRTLSFHYITPETRDMRLTGEFSEYLSLARGLAFLGFENCVAVRQAQGVGPDFEVTLTDGREIGVEATVGFTSAAYVARLENLINAISKRLRSEQLDLSGRLLMLSFAKVWENGLAVNMGGSPPIPDDIVPANRNDVKEFINDFVAWIRVGQHMLERPILEPISDDRFKALSKWHTIIDSSETAFTPGLLDISRPHIAQSTEQIRESIEERIKAKLELSPRYGAHRPRWLFIDLEDRFGFRGEAALYEILSSGVDIKPFERVLVMCDGVAIDLSSTACTRISATT